MTITLQEISQFYMLICSNFEVICTWTTARCVSIHEKYVEKYTSYIWSMQERKPTRLLIKREYIGLIATLTNVYGMYC